jgi:uncharacterized coiled-coil protein SlyX
MEQIELSGSEICRMEIRNLNSELARVRTHSAAQADTVAELNGEIAELRAEVERLKKEKKRMATCRQILWQANMDGGSHAIYCEGHIFDDPESYSHFESARCRCVIKDALDALAG